MYEKHAVWKNTVALTRFSPTEQSRWRCTTGTEMAGECVSRTHCINCKFSIKSKIENPTTVKRKTYFSLYDTESLSHQSSGAIFCHHSPYFSFFSTWFFFSIYILTDVFVDAPSHDFIGDFTTSYRELARGQSQFNVYEVSGSHFNTHCASHHISATGDVSVSDISIVLMLWHISLYMDIFLI